MQIQINLQHLSLRPSQEDTIRMKVEKLTHLADRLRDESSHAKVDLMYVDSRRPEDAYECHITFFVPHGTLHAESHADSVENAVDDVMDKLRGQIEHYKAKIHRDEKRHSS